MKYRAVITHDFDALDCPELRRRKRELEAWVAAFDRHFGPASVVIRERRQRLVPRASPPTRIWHFPPASSSPLSDDGPDASGRIPSYSGGRHSTPDIANDPNRAGPEPGPGHEPGE